MLLFHSHVRTKAMINHSYFFPQSYAQPSQHLSHLSSTEADGAVPRSFKSRIGGRHVAALLGQKAGGGNAAPSQVPKAPPSGLPAGPPARQPVSGAKPPADIRKRHAHPASGRGNMSPAQKVSLLRQPGSGAKPLADVSRHEQMRRGPPASGKGNQSPAEEDPEAVKKALKEQAREFAKGGTGGSAADFAKQVVRQAGFVIDRRGEGGAGRPSQKERPSELGEGGQGNGPQTLVLYDPLGNGGALKAEGVQTETLGQELKKMFLLPPKRLREKYMRCRLPAEGNDGTNEDGLSVADKIRE